MALLNFLKSEQAVVYLQIVGGICILKKKSISFKPDPYSFNLFYN